MSSLIKAAAALGVGLICTGQAQARVESGPLEGQVWEVVISSSAEVYHRAFTIEFRFQDGCVEMSAEGSDLEFEPCGSQFALTAMDEGSVTYAFSYDFPYTYIYPSEAGFSTSAMEAEGHAQGDADCAGFELMEVGEQRTDICGLPELESEHQGAQLHYSAITRTQ